MKRYEAVPQLTLTPRMPAILRIDGRAFHSFTRGFEYPFDKYLSDCMQATALSLVRDIPTASLAYGQSDEISILLIDYSSLQTEQWFGGKVQKIVSVAASNATISFNRNLSQHLKNLFNHYIPNLDKDEATDRWNSLNGKENTAMFDARVFPIPESDVANYFYWRWKDATRNSVSMAARAHFSHKQLSGKNVARMKDMLRYDADDPWEDMPEFFKDGWTVRKAMREDFDRFVWNIEPVDQDIRSISQQAIELSKEGLRDEQEEQESED